MELRLGVGEWIAIGLSAILLIWLFAANAYSRRRGIATYRWLYRALDGLGGTMRTEWIGSSSAGARLLVEKASKPFRKVEAIYLLEPREFLPYWVYSRMRGKRDEVRIQFVLRSVPMSLVTVTKAGSRRSKDQNMGDTSRASASDQSWMDFQIRYDGLENQRLMGAVQSFLQDHADSLTAIELRRKTPHLEIRARISPLLEIEAESFIEPLTAWFQGEVLD